MNQLIAILLFSVLGAACSGGCSANDGTEAIDGPESGTADVAQAGDAPQDGAEDDAERRDGDDSEQDGDDDEDASAPQRVDTCTAPAAAAVADAVVPDGVCASIWASRLSDPRGIALAPNGDILVVERSAGRVTALWDEDGDGLSGADERAVLASERGLNHGVAVHDGFLYASSPTTVYRWPYTEGAREELGESSVVLRDIPRSGHSTRTLKFDEEGRLYVSVGSAGNVDPDSSRSRILRVDVASGIPEGGWSFGDAEVFADGLRNEVGLAFDHQGRLWGVENGRDNLRRDDLGGDIHEDNPAEELNLFDEPGRFYGYPYCWTEFRLPPDVGNGPNTQWVDPNFMDDGVHSDAWCRNTENVVAPEFSMQAHSAPLGLEFYQGGSFPEDYVGDAIVPFHGSWNRDVPTGYKVVRIDFRDGEPVEVIPLLEYGGRGDIGRSWPHRPVDVVQGERGELYVTSDASGIVFVLGHEGE